MKVSVMRQGTGKEGVWFACLSLLHTWVGSLTYRFGFSTNRPMGPSPQTYPLNPMRCECYCHLGWAGRKICDEPTSNLPVTEPHSSIHHEPRLAIFQFRSLLNFREVGGVGVRSGGRVFWDRESYGFCDTNTMSCE